jgi:phenylacetate-CoA ligase
MEPEERSAELSRECGIPLPILRKVEGREDAILLATDGSLVHGDIISAAARDRIRIKHARFIQHTPRTATLMLSGDVDSALGKEFIDQIKLRLGADMQIELQIVDDIPPLPSGKQRYALREFDLKEIRT